MSEHPTHVLLPQHPGSSRSTGSPPALPPALGTSRPKARAAVLGRRGCGFRWGTRGTLLLGAAEAAGQAGRLRQRRSGEGSSRGADALQAEPVLLLSNRTRRHRSLVLAELHRLLVLKLRCCAVPAAWSWLRKEVIPPGPLPVQGVLRWGKGAAVPRRVLLRGANCGRRGWGTQRGSSAPPLWRVPQLVSSRWGLPKRSARAQRGTVPAPGSARAGSQGECCGAALCLTELSCPRSVRCGGATEGRHRRERLLDSVLDCALLLLPLGHADLTALRPPPVPLTECYAGSPLLSRPLSVTVINALLCTAQSFCLSVLAPCWGGGCTPLF